MTLAVPPQRARPVVLIANAREDAVRSFGGVFPAAQFDVRHVGTGALAISAARELRPVAVIIDYDLPELDCAAVCRALVADPEFPLSTPIVITSETNPGRARQLATLRAGAWDFCVQPLNGGDFYQKIMTFVGASWVVEHARSASFVEESTGPASENAFRRRAGEFVAQLARERQAGTLLLISISVDDGDARQSAGGEPAVAPAGLAGDDTVSVDHRITVAVECVQRVSRASDVLAAIGPGEIGIMMRDGTDTGVHALMRRVGECLMLRRSADPRLSAVRLQARFGKVALLDAAAADLGAAIDEVRRTPPIVL